MSQPRPTDPIGSIGWTQRTRGSADRSGMPHTCQAPAAGELNILAGRLAMALRMHSGRRSSIDPASLVPPDSTLARDAEVAAQDLLRPSLLNHSSRAYTWGAAIAALHGITFDRELLYLAAMFHDTGIPSPVPDVDFTVRSAALAREFTDSHHVPADVREHVANAIAMHHTPGVGLESGAEAYLLSRRRSRRCVRPTQQRDTRCSPPERHPAVPAVGLQAGVRRASPSGGEASPSWPRLVPAPLRLERPEHSARALPWLM